jgi:hypothetical protein
MEAMDVLIVDRVTIRSSDIGPVCGYMMFVNSWTNRTSGRNRRCKSFVIAGFVTIEYRHPGEDTREDIF